MLKGQACAGDHRSATSPNKKAPRSRSASLVLPSPKEKEPDQDENGDWHSQQPQQATRQHIILPGTVLATTRVGQPFPEPLLASSECSPIVLSRKPIMSRPRRVGLPWYAAEHYDVLRQTLFDGGKLPTQYEAWRVSTEQVEREVQRSGVEVVRVSIEPYAFMKWCDRTRLPPDGTARARYAAEVLER